MIVAEHNTRNIRVYYYSPAVWWKIKKSTPWDFNALSAVSSTGEGGGNSRFAPGMRADNFFRDARQSFEKGKKEGKKSLSLSPVKLNFTLLFLLSLLPPLLRKELFVGPFSEETMFVRWDFNSRLWYRNEWLIRNCINIRRIRRMIVIPLRKNVVQRSSYFRPSYFQAFVINRPSSSKHNRITIKINGQRAVKSY